VDEGASQQRMTRYVHVKHNCGFETVARIDGLNQKCPRCNQKFRIGEDMSLTELDVFQLARFGIQASFTSLPRITVGRP
jgi:hypothetical protein